MAKRVKALREHNNSYGDKVRKTTGAEYDMPEGGMLDHLVDRGLVALVEAPAADAGKAGK